ncbi:hypothetical protein [Roseovarius sp. SYSU LYC5161]|jgi:hypothetical protein|uniref:hypothetical protein n=1 Tax=Roseovarius halophilus (ex Wu et al. 2025) TaxID=3376060 RepID=UPI00287115E1|nr:hypothetical protein [Roseovarius sp.]
MTDLKSELDRLIEMIEASDGATRHVHHPALRRLIERMEEAGQKVPCAVQDLDEELLAEAIEAQFDNVPV